MAHTGVPQVRIRACTPPDLDEVLQLDRQWAQEDIAYDFQYVSREEFSADLARFPAYFLVAESARGLVGYIHATVRLHQRVAFIPDQTACLEIQNLYVKADFRSRHIGSQLMDRLLAVAGQNGLQRVLVSTDSKDMDRVLRFYQGHGFKPWHVQLFK